MSATKWAKQTDDSEFKNLAGHVTIFKTCLGCSTKYYICHYSSGSQILKEDKTSTLQGRIESICSQKSAGLLSTIKQVSVVTWIHKIELYLQILRWHYKTKFFMHSTYRVKAMLPHSINFTGNIRRGLLWLYVEAPIVKCKIKWKLFGNPALWLLTKQQT